MIRVDANLLIYAHVQGMPDHDTAHRWLDEQFNSLPRVGPPWPSLLAFLRLVSNHRIFEKPVSISEAWRQVERWLTVPSVWIPSPTDRHQLILRKLLTEIDQKANLVPDAHLVTLAIEHGLTLCSTDRDFSRFSSLKWQNPIAGSAA